MARTPLPPGPPPRHYRPPGSPRPPGTPPDLRSSRPIPSPPPPRRGRWAPALAVVVVVLGGALALAAWRGADDSSSDVEATASTSSTLATGGTIPPNTTTSSPPSTELDPDVIGTVDDPIPLGEPYILGVFEVTVNGADFDAADTLADHDATNPAPPAGERRVLIEVTIRFVESRGFTDTAYLPFEVRSGSDAWTDLDAGCGNVPDSMLTGVLLGPGDAATGNLCFTVPEEQAEDVLLTTEGFAGPVFFALR